MAMFFIFMLFIIFDQEANENPIMNSFSTLVSYVNIFIWASLALYFKTKQKDYFKLIRFTLLFSFITVLISLFWSVLMPELVRKTVSRDNLDLYVAYSKLGLMNYGFAHALPLLFPFIIFMAKNESKINKVLLLSALVISLFLLFKASITTSFFLGTLMSIIAFFLKAKNLQQFFIKLIIGSVILFFFGNTISIATLEFIQPFGEGSPIEDKIGEVLMSLKGQDLDQSQIAVRAELHELSRNTLASNFLTGAYDKNQTGGHSFFTDYLAHFGIIGFLPFLLFIFFHLRYFFRKIYIVLKPYFLLSVFYFIAISLLKGRPLPETFALLLFVVPGLALYVSHAYCNKSKVNDLH
jgi:hypothetical protein